MLWTKNYGIWPQQGSVPSTNCSKIVSSILFKRAIGLFRGNQEWSWGRHASFYFLGSTALNYRGAGRKKPQASSAKVIGLDEEGNEMTSTVGAFPNFISLGIVPSRSVTMIQGTSSSGSWSMVRNSLLRWCILSALEIMPEIKKKSRTFWLPFVVRSGFPGSRLFTGP